MSHAFQVGDIAVFDERYGTLLKGDEFKVTSVTGPDYSGIYNPNTDQIDDNRLIHGLPLGSYDPAREVGAFAFRAHLRPDFQPGDYVVLVEDYGTDGEAGDEAIVLAKLPRFTTPTHPGNGYDLYTVLLNKNEQTLSLYGYRIKASRELAEKPQIDPPQRGEWVESREQLDSLPNGSVILFKSVGTLGNVRVKAFVDWSALVPSSGWFVPGDGSVRTEDTLDLLDIQDALVLHVPGDRRHLAGSQ